MLTHIVVWKYKKETSEQAREEHLRKLNGLPDLIPDIESFDIGSDILQLERSYDTGLVAVFQDRAALESYTVHDEHQKVAAMGKEIAEHAVSVDFLSD
ncbi:MAG: Dabb family protein [Pyrinomonadaceae bacterium]|nr:Dabb family protein [Pyrinomonadaceae bacterium]